MVIRIEMPNAIEERLRAEFGDVTAAAKEAMGVEFYRQGRISHGELAQLLGKSRYELDGLLKQYGVTEDMITPAELDEQVAALRKLLGR